MINYIFATIIAIILGQVSNHLIRRLPEIIEEEKAYKKLVPTLTKNFKFDVVFSAIFLMIFNLLIFVSGSGAIQYIYMVLISMLTVVFVIDFKMQLIPDTVQAVILILGIIVTIMDHANWLNHIIGMVTGAGIFLLIALFSIIVFRKEGMGMGDVKLMAGIGLIFGINSLPNSIMSFMGAAEIILTITVFAFFIAAIAAIILIVTKNTEKSSYMAFGPYIVIATTLVIFFGTEPFVNLFFSMCTGLANLVTELLIKVIK